MIDWHAVVAESAKVSGQVPVFVGSREECETELAKLNAMDAELRRPRSRGLAEVVCEDDTRFSVRPVRVVL